MGGFGRFLASLWERVPRPNSPQTAGKFSEGTWQLRFQQARAPGAQEHTVGLRRYVTLEVTDLPALHLERVVGALGKKAQCYDACRFVQVAGFETDGKRYVIVSGESDAERSEPSKRDWHEYAQKVTDGTNAQVAGPVVIPAKAREP